MRREGTVGEWYGKGGLTFPPFPSRPRYSTQYHLVMMWGTFIPANCGVLLIYLHFIQHVIFYWL